MTLISVIIPIGSFELDRTNLQKIIRSSKGFTCELIFIVDTDENHVQNKLQECCNQLEVHNFKILICFSKITEVRFFNSFIKINCLKDSKYKDMFFNSYFLAC